MEAEHATRKQQLLEECQVAPEIFDQVMPRLATFMAPFVDPCCRQEPAEHAHTYVCGLLSNVARKNVESIAYRFGQDRLPLQRFIGWAPWEDGPLRQELTRQGRRALGPRRGRIGLRPLGLSQVWNRVGGCGAPVVRPPGQGRQLSSRHLLGLRVGCGSYPGRHAPVFAPSMDHGQGSPRQSWRAQRP